LSSLIGQGKAQYFDMVYIDGSHETPDVLADAVLAYQLLRIGGLMIFDDYVWGAGASTEPLLTPKLAIDSFLNCYQRKVQVHTWLPLCQVYCRKIA
jgi:predicted O-methyltransferase YrrM